MFQSRDQAEHAAQALGEKGYEVRHGKIEKSSGNFMFPDLERQR
jgi:hypothetical protein